MLRRSVSLPSLLLSALALFPVLAPAPAQAEGAPPAAGVLKFHEPLFRASDGATSATIDVERIGGTLGPVSVSFATAPETAVAGVDFVPTSGHLEWPSGDATPKTFTVQILPGGAPHGGKTVKLGLFDPTGGATILEIRKFAQLVLGERGTGGPGDPPPAGAVGFDAGEYGVQENAGQAVVTVVRRAGSHGAVSVHYATGESTGEANVDFAPVQGNVSWGDGEAGPKSFFVPVIDDTEANRPIYVRLRLSDPTGGATLPPPVQTAVLEIRDNDQDNPGGPENGPGVLYFGEPRFQIVEGQEAVIRVNRGRGRQGEVSVHFATSDGSAVTGEDYTPAIGTLTWADGEAGTKTFRVPTIHNVNSHGFKTVNLSITNPTGGATLAPEHDSSVLGILDLDGDRNPCAGDDTTLCLSRGRFRAAVTWRTADGNSGPGHAVPINGQSGTFWFFDPDNSEMLIKVLDACAISHQYWVFFAATTNVSFTVQVTDTATGLTKEYTSALGQPAEPVQDTISFPCE